MSECPTCGSGYFALAGHYKEIEAERDALRARVQELEKELKFRDSQWVCEEALDWLRTKYEEAEDEMRAAGHKQWANRMSDALSDLSQLFGECNIERAKKEAAEKRVARLEEALRITTASLYAQRQRCNCRGKMSGSCPNCQRIIDAERAATAALDAKEGA